ncbi:DUF1990 domain-containing protein [Actinokineospora bangkokensis]|uniref:DUF1990 domain-containing protein n=1 Tax=Actinokineospora bangkokensis TaxID=1193682 RepID=UPI001E657366|nr:DUF1990 domain-containing protein [Actinokineospora bangkokensis]
MGATASALPDGYRTVRRSRLLAPGRTFAEASELLMGWKVHERAGLAVTASAPRAKAGVDVTMRFAFVFSVPCRVVYTVEEDDVCGFAYGTLPGHPERGEERFVLSKTDAGVLFEIVAFSRHASLVARAGGPVTRLVQDAMTSRYLRAI